MDRCYNVKVLLWGGTTVDRCYMGRFYYRQVLLWTGATMGRCYYGEVLLW